jgi:Protein of unknown function (DUF2567)
VSTDAWIAHESPAADGQTTSPAVGADLRVAGALVVVLAVLGALLGLVWAWWSPPGPAAQVLGGGQFIPDETESFIAGDGRYLVITAVTGLAATLVLWFLRRDNRGPLALLGLAVGAFAGALITALVGHLAGGGSDTGKVFALSDGSKAQVTRSLTLSLHAHGLLLVEPLVVALVYGLLASFAVHDDLGRPDLKRAAIAAARQDAGVAPAPVGPNFFGTGSVGASDHAQDGGRYGDAAGPAQQRDLPPQ